MTQPQRKLFAISQNGIHITYDPLHSHAATHFADSPQIRQWVKSILQKTVIVGDVMEFETDTKQELGSCDLVKTDDSDDIVFAIRKNRDRPMRFTKTRQPGTSSKVAIVLKRISDTEFDLFSAWLGPLTPSTPGSPYATKESKPFWANHALVWGRQEIIPGSETTINPWN